MKTHPRRIALAAVAAAGLLLTPRPAAAAGCPVAGVRAPALTVQPAIPQPARPFTVTIADPDAGTANGLAVRLDGEDKLLPATVVDTNERLRFTTTVDKLQGAPEADHWLTVRYTDKNNCDVEASYLIPHVPLLKEVGVMPMSNRDHTYRVFLKGDGFDTGNRNRIKVDDVPLDVCWTGDQCAPTAIIRGTVVDRHMIVLSGLDPDQESAAPYRICNIGLDGMPCSAAVADAVVRAAHWWVLALAVGVMLAAIGLVVLLVTRGNGTVVAGRKYIVRALLLDKETDTYSLSKLQFYIWTAVAVFGYAYLAISRNAFQGWSSLPSVPAGLPGIVGIAAGTSVGAQVITQVNGPKGAGKLEPSIADLISSGDVVAADRVQFLVWTLVGAIGYFLTIAALNPRAIIDLPDVPSTILAISGISSFGYLGGKLARNAGPIVNELIVRKGPDPDAVASGAAAPAAAQFGVIEIRGRTLSQDATFKISRGPESGPDDVPLTFDHLEPSPLDNRGIQKPRVVEKDDDAGVDATVAKRLMLVVRLDTATTPLFDPGKKHTLTVVNPDSQRVVFKFDVPDTQRTT